MYNQKFISIYDSTTYRTYTATFDIESFLIAEPTIGDDGFGVYISDSKALNKGAIHEGYASAVSDPRKQESSGKCVDFRQVFSAAGLNYPEHLDKQLFIPQCDRYYNFRMLSPHQAYLPTHYTTQAILIVKLVPHSSQPLTPAPLLCQQQALSVTPSHPQPHNARHQETKDRDRSRTIGQIMKYVYQWRQIAENGINGVKVNLQEAAVYTGVPKKSLDDYYYQLRVGEKYEFDFEANRGRNISVLRKFVKQNMPKRNKARKNNKMQENVDNSSNLQQQSVRQRHQQQDEDEKQNKRIPKKLKTQLKPQNIILMPQTIESTRKTSINQAQNQSLVGSIGGLSDLKIGRLSDSDNSFQNFWPNVGAALKSEDGANQDIYDDEDSFFQAFKGGNDFAKPSRL